MVIRNRFADFSSRSNNALGAGIGRRNFGKEDTMMQTRKMVLMTMTMLGLIVTTSPTAAFQNDTGLKPQKPQDQNMSKKEVVKKESPFACNVFGLTAEQRQRHVQLVKRLISTKQEIRELADGYEVRFNVETSTIQELAEFMTYERLCCPFFDLELVLEREGGPAWLRLKGREGVKEFIRTEFGIR